MRSTQTNCATETMCVQLVGVCVHSAAWFHKPFGLKVCVPYHFSSVPCFRLSPIDVVIRRHEDDSISELFRLDSVLLHRSLVFPKVIAVLCVLVKFYT